MYDNKIYIKNQLKHQIQKLLQPLSRPSKEKKIISYFHSTTRNNTDAGVKDGRIINYIFFNFHLFDNRLTCMIIKYITRIN